MKFYIASSFQQKDRVKWLAEQLIQSGHTWTFDWTKNERALTVERLATVGELQRKAVREADVLIILLPAGIGSHVELGIALAEDKQAFVYSPVLFSEIKNSTFYYVEGVERYQGLIENFSRFLVETLA